MSVLWLIIKVTLWILLILFLTFTFVLLLGLMAPIRYDCLYEKYEKSYCHLRVSFLGIIKANVVFEDDKQESHVKILGKVVYRYHTDDFEEEVKETVHHTVNHAEDVSKDVVEEESDARGESKSGTTKWRVIKDLLLDKRFFSLLKDIFVAVRRILRWIKPYKLHFELIIGKEDPADTGELIAQIALLYPLYYKYGIVEGSYDEAGLWGKLCAIGKFHLITLVKIIILFIMNKETRDYIRLLLKTRKEA